MVKTKHIKISDTNFTSEHWAKFRVRKPWWIIFFHKCNVVWIQ